MSLLAAAVPVAVLVLAWDEATPAVRAVVEATETTAPVFDSVVVLVPAAAGEPTQEEFLPLVSEPEPLALVAPPAPTTTEADLGEEMAAAPVPAPAAALPIPVTLPAVEDLSPLPPPAATLPPEEAELPATPQPLGWATVRVLHLSSFSLPKLTALSKQALPLPIWVGSSALPTAPYLGSAEAVREPGSAAPAAAALHALAAPPPGLPGGVELPLFPELSAAAQLLYPTPGTTPDYQLTALPLPALEAEADLAPTDADEPIAPAAPAEAPLAEPTGPAQAGWSEALASLQAPRLPEEPAPASDYEDEATYYAATTGEPLAADASPAELRPATQPFESPNLNFQVIQYARFAVPLALAQAPFAVIYAPAWPTWLAAQELRYRTRQPLVLHVATLAASAEESIETATGWQAELQRQALQRADLILTETPALAYRLRRDLDLPPSLVRTVPAADAAAVAQALRTAQLRPTANQG